MPTVQLFNIVVVLCAGIAGLFWKQRIDYLALAVMAAFGVVWSCLAIAIEYAASFIIALPKRGDLLGIATMEPLGFGSIILIGAYGTVAFALCRIVRNLLVDVFHMIRKGK